MGNNTVDTVLCELRPPCEPGSYRNSLTEKCETCMSECSTNHHYVSSTCSGYEVAASDPSSCLPCQEDCGPNAYRVGCQKHSSGFCQAATECTTGLSYEIEPLTSFHDRTCASCSACAPYEYVASMCNGTYDTVCNKLTVCTSFEFEKSSPTAYQDRVCSPIEHCDFNLEYQILHNAPIENPICVRDV